MWVQTQQGVHRHKLCLLTGIEAPEGAWPGNVGLTAGLSEGIRPCAQDAAVESDAEVRGAGETGILAEGNAQDGEG